VTVSRRMAAASCVRLTGVMTMALIVERLALYAEIELTLHGTMKNH
jgi:hypothetical protein